MAYADPAANAQSQPRTTASWTAVTDAPLLGMKLAREAGSLLTWDDAQHVLLICAANGTALAESRAPGNIRAATISDDGSLIALLLLDEPRILTLNDQLEPLDVIAAPHDATAVAVDPLGRYLALATESCHIQFFTRGAQVAGQFETLQPVAFLRFVATQPLLLAASAYGTLQALDLEPGRTQGTLRAQERWRSQMMANVGRLECTGDAGTILASCFTHGVQRIDGKGRNEGSYHLGGTAAHAVPDFPGRSIAVSTTEGELFLLNRQGVVRWKQGLPRPISALEVDGLGRFLIMGQSSGQISRLDLEPASQPAGRPSSTSQAPDSPAVQQVSTSKRRTPLRDPSWTTSVAQTDEEAETAVLGVLDDPPRIAVMTSRNQLTVFTEAGGLLGQTPGILGVGRSIVTSPGWIVAFTDRQILLYEARRNDSRKLDVSLVEVTHLAAEPDSYGLAVVQERDRIGRITPAGRWIWKRELRSPVEDLTVGEGALTAVSTDDGKLTIYNPAGEPIGSFVSIPPEPLFLARAPAATAGSDVAWVSLARRSQTLRGHNQSGQILWESLVPWEAWSLKAVSKFLVAEAPDGRSLAVDSLGQFQVQGRAQSALGPLLAVADDPPCRVFRHAEHLICAELSGKVQWRSICQDTIGPLAAGRPGVVAMIGRSLAWFPNLAPEAR